jgi:hypothetical protein
MITTTIRPVQSTAIGLESLWKLHLCAEIQSDTIHTRGSTSQFITTLPKAAKVAQPAKGFWLVFKPQLQSNSMSGTIHLMTVHESATKN